MSPKTRRRIAVAAVVALSASLVACAPSGAASTDCKPKTSQGFTVMPRIAPPPRIAPAPRPVAPPKISTPVKPAPSTPKVTTPKTTTPTTPQQHNTGVTSPSWIPFWLLWGSSQRSGC
ncbi:hypothetical protein MRBLMI12_000444 [Microbacterium sp. LMI12-1-1.1]|uniref:hypothetical protein n=1 Tax=Microbacterium sp. LMI12-1-1.1 TaxID=3135225 RepID=UPI0034493AD8